MRCYCMIRDQPVYRREVFLRGLAAAGYDLAPIHHLGVGKPGDVLLIWNRYGLNHDNAVKFEREGGSVWVAENAYVGLNRADRRRYALARGGHNGQGSWSPGGPERWQLLGIPIKPWRTEGNHVLVLPNRSFGRPGFIMPPMWPETVVQRLKKLTRRPVVVRPHPGNDPSPRPLTRDLANAWCAVIWSSSAGCEALLEGIPVFSECPAWITKRAASGELTRDNLETPPLPDRLPAFEALAWAQWTVEEIESGAPFQHLRDQPRP